MNNKLMLFVCLGLVWALAACQPVTPAATPASSILEIGKEIQVEGGSYQLISVAELNSLMDNKDFLLVNVHIPFEGNLPQNDLSIPYDTIAQNLDQLPADKRAKIVLYCRSGGMSKIAATELVRLGYSNIMDLEGGMVAWEGAGLVIER